MPFFKVKRDSYSVVTNNLETSNFDFPVEISRKEAFLESQVSDGEISSTLSSLWGWVFPGDSQGLTSNYKNMLSIICNSPI